MKSNRKNVPPPAIHRIRGLEYDLQNTKKYELIKMIASTALSSNAKIDFQIRDGYINLYYRGGALFTIKISKSNKTKISVDKKYFKRMKAPCEEHGWLPNPIDSWQKWAAIQEKMQCVMDGWFAEHPKEERELQHHCATKYLNNINAKWVVLDIEYACWLHGNKENKKGADSRRLCKIDMIAVRREDAKSNASKLPVYLVELKVGSGAVSGKSGIKSHAEDFRQLLDFPLDKKAKEALIKSINNIVREKMALGLLPGYIMNDFNKEICLYPSFVFHNHSVAAEEINTIEQILKSHSNENMIVNDFIQ